MRVFAIGLTICLSLASGCKSTGSKPLLIPKDVLAQVEEFAAVLLEEETTPGCVLGIATRDGHWIQGFGQRALDDPRLPDSTTLFEIGSISKVFTSLLLLEAEARGEVQLDDPLARHVPAGFTVPEAGQPIRLMHLAMHASGLPRMPVRFKSKDPADPYAGFPPDQTFDWLMTTRVKSPPMTKYVYSNFAVGILGEVLVRVANSENYGDLLQQRLAQPLGLRDTTIQLTADQQLRVAQGHDGGMTPVPNWTLDVFAGAGAIRSTMTDMLTFGLSQTDPNPIHARAQVVRFKPENPGVNMALGWHVNVDTGVLWHNGQTGGYHSFLAIAPESGLVVCVLSNSSDGSCELLANGCFQLMCGREAMPPMTIRRSGHPSVEQVEKLVGSYKIGPMATFSITTEDERVYAQLTFQPRIRIYPDDAAGLTYHYRNIDAEITFAQDETGKITGLTLHQGGRDLPGPRTEPAAPK